MTVAKAWLAGGAIMLLPQCLFFCSIATPWLGLHAGWLVMCLMGASPLLAAVAIVLMLRKDVAHMPYLVGLAFALASCLMQWLVQQFVGPVDLAGAGAGLFVWSFLAGTALAAVGRAAAGLFVAGH
ncbi:hypothetical protein [Andreprevotia lacus]|nr:hypothetical protein [Andreprevotia lacus]